MVKFRMENAAHCFGSFVISIIVMEVCCPAVFSRWSCYHKLNRSQKLEWNARTVSSIHAIIVTLRASYIAFYRTYPDLVWVDDEMTLSNIAVTCGYLLADLVLILIYREKIGGTYGLLLHHVVTAYAYFLILSNGFLAFFGNYKLVCELSTVFVNIRWKLSALNMKSSKVYFVNGLVMTGTFFLTRIFLTPFFYRHVYATVQTNVYQESVSPFVHCTWLAVSFTLDVLNIVWFNKMLGGVKQFLDAKSKSDDLKS